MYNQYINVQKPVNLYGVIFMILNFEYEKLKNILINLYNITKVRTVIYDSTFEKIASFPENSCMFCEMVKSEEKTRLMCKKK